MKTFYTPKNWMSYIENGKMLTELTIPGTHDSGTYPSNYAPAKCQTMNFTDQLNSGIRFLDIRLKRGYDADKDHVLWVYHGIADMDISFNGKVLGDCFQFLRDNSSETIIMSIKNESSPSKDGDKEKFYDDLKIAMGQFPNLFYTEDKIPSLKDIRGKIVLVRRFGLGKRAPIGLNLYDNWPDDSANYLSNNGITYYVQDVYYNWSSGSDKANKFNTYVKNALITAENGERSMLCFNFTSATGVTGGVLPFASTPRDLAEAVNPLFLQYMKSNNKGRYGIIPMDFPEFPSNKDLIMDLIASNQFIAASSVV
ncbi:phosphatidylinositol-specific phospholipase C [Chryseobacterium sp. FH2]|uniref:phosphatidylinositol-specific phospholipase C n=1 Tax=Chryseobacterium sp. FH2 TaxID=1674291 RepID=UPI00065AB0A1|nr:phosphatidylinositol-specific phospholipase C [Chryseobacterium sp. FH2]